MNTLEPSGLDSFNLNQPTNQPIFNGITQRIGLVGQGPEYHSSDNNGWVMGSPPMDLVHISTMKPF